ncbi:hypothetical protein [Dyella mobilis]|uniref:Uncharacterized protein n=1 Tax=Dyella mobilis TaxID=1849582 RepID=A0ABS2KFL8_9GAMM|nr:hypothetical protein [Dyella mobilis]MBM7129884.1 hypothetical protein [Dyella mobilis]
MFIGLAVFTLLSALYCALGVVQAACLFSGDRAVRNVEFWGTLACIAAALSIIFGVFAIRAIVKAKRHVVS